MNKKIIFSFFLLIQISLSTMMGQRVFKDGYLITLENDTIYGKIKDGGEKRNTRECNYKSDLKSNVVRYLPDDIKSYRIIGEKSYTAKQIFYRDEYNFVFLELLIEGKINLYHDIRNEKMSFYLEEENGPLLGLGLRSLDLKANTATAYYNDKYEEWYFNVYKETLLSVFQASPEALKKIDLLEYDSKSIMDITRTYIEEICDGKDCIKFEKVFK